MFNFLSRRLLSTIPVLLIVAVLVFLMLRLTPGDPAAILAGDAANTEQIAQIRTSLGLDRPIPEQFAIWFGHMLHRRPGRVYYYKMPGHDADRPAPGAHAVAGADHHHHRGAGGGAAGRAGGLALRRLARPRADGLFGAGLLGAGVRAGLRADLARSLKLGWLPVQGYKRLADGVGPWLYHLMLPAITLSVIYIALIARVTRASVLETLGEDYIRTARAKGLPEVKVLMRHALANAAVPIVTVIGIGIALLIGGVVVTESVYAIPGLGRLTVDAVLARDFPTIQGVILLFSFVYVMINLLVDLSYVFFDPRIRY